MPFAAAPLTVAFTRIAARLPELASILLISRTNDIVSQYLADATWVATDSNPALCLQRVGFARNEGDESGLSSSVPSDATQRFLQIAKAKNAKIGDSP
jgi:hypothetical protein